MTGVSSSFEHLGWEFCPWHVDKTIEFLFSALFFRRSFIGLSNVAIDHAGVCMSVCVM